MTIDATLACQATVELAKIGQGYWQKLFHTSGTAAQWHQIAENICSLPEGSNIQIVLDSQQCIVLWGLLYDKPGPITAETLDWLGFWGYRYILNVLPPGRYRAPTMTVTPFTIKLFFNDDANLRRFTNEQERMSGTLFTQGKGNSLPVTVWGKTHVEQTLQQPNDASLLYFYCHGEYPDLITQPGALPDEAALIFSHGQAVTNLADLRRLPTAPFTAKPLVFLNTCEGATQNAFWYDGFMPFFVEQQWARGFISTEVKMPQLLARDLAQRFFAAFVQGTPVGEILWNLRRYYLNEHHNINILAFNYSLYSLSEVCLAQPEVDTTATHREAATGITGKSESA